MASVTFKINKVANGYTVEDRTNLTKIYVAKTMDEVREILDQSFKDLEGSGVSDKKYPSKKVASVPDWEELEE